MLRLMPRVKYSAVFVREEDLVPRSLPVAYSQHVYVKHTREVMKPAMFHVKHRCCLKWF